MAQNFKIAGLNMDSIFKAKVKTSAGTTGFTNSGTDINTLYEAYRSFASKGAGTGYSDGGTDLNSIFLKIGVPIVDGSDWDGYSNSSMTDAPAAGTPCNAYIYAGVGGTFSITENGSTSGQVYDWLDITGGTNGTNHYVKYSYTGDQPTYGNISTSYTAITGNWYLGWQGQTTSRSATITISIAESATGTNAISWTADWTLTYDPGYTVNWGTTARFASSSSISPTAPGTIYIYWNTDLSVNVTGEDFETVTSDSPYATGGAGTNYEIYWNKISQTGAGASMSNSSGFSEDGWVGLGSQRWLSFSGTQTTTVQREYVVDVSIRVAGDAGSSVTKRITVTTTCDL